MVKETLVKAIDWFIPSTLRTDTASLWQARIFAISHLVGPFLGVIPTSAYPSLRFWPSPASSGCCRLR
jgi:hypothetical protein